ncbi:uncharacterized protein LOC110104634 [Dendrobium catenatum]|uniref:uncharacterized protein LOC110104634 n=1 Tax=Dendrobium catenatum TaxID=906689 RepID=UPI0009F666C2|nr:uncharacterized protein LOC110104634 [Dendrobium catenatum]
MKVIHNLISEEQVAFINGRSLSDHVLIAQELKEGYSNLIMECITDPIFIVHVNGLLTNAFSYEGKRLGFKITPMAPRISHLLFADDTLMFSLAKRENVLNIKKITFDYCYWTSQKVNFSKSAVIFSNNIERRRKRELSIILGIKEVKEINDLGINMTLRRHINADFSIILEKAAAKLDIWGNKFISMPGRVILIKIVVQALHVFYSSLSMIPLSILKKLDRLSRDFLWSKKNGSNGIHYISWKVVCRPENQGGLGIIAATNSIEPLRAKHPGIF